MNTKDIGTLGEAKAIAFYVELGYEVSIPIGDRRPYDLIVERGGWCSCVQVKCTMGHEVDLRISGGNKSKDTHKKYIIGDFDVLCIVKITDCETKFFTFKAEDVIGRSSITVR